MIFTLTEMFTTNALISHINKNIHMIFKCFDHIAYMLHFLLRILFVESELYDFKRLEISSVHTGKFHILLLFCDLSLQR